MTGPNTRNQDGYKPRSRNKPKTRRPDERTNGHRPRSTDEGSERVSRREEEAFDPNVNQPPPD